MTSGPSGPAPTEPLNRQMDLMKQARSTATFDSSELACLIHGGQENVEQRRAAFERVETLIGSRDTSKLPPSYGNMNREDLYEEGLEVGKATFEDMLKHKHRVFEHVGPRYVLINSSPFGMTTIMFEPTIHLQASNGQKQKWLPLSETGQIIGAYVSTELGHGSFVRGMETTATYDEKTDEFIINSPTVSSTKFWPGASGFSCTHAIVTARLTIRGKDYGPHFFMVQFRRLEDGTPLPGITSGDIGLKMGYNGTCNGYTRFENVRIPREDMLSKHAQVDRCGNYKGSQPPQVAHATLLMVRSIIVRAVGFQLAQAVTIAARYSSVREQGLGPNGLLPTESTIISYKTQHFRILNLIASSYAILFASELCNETYKELRKQQDCGNNDGLPYAHCTAAGLKAWSTQTGADGAEDARKCCGGQGYMAISGLPDIVGAVVAMATFEGENYVLWQQVGRVLFKFLDAVKAGKTIDPRMNYLAKGYAQLVETEDDKPATRTVLTPEGQLEIYRHRAVRLICDTYHAVRSSTETPAKAWNTHMFSIIAAARAHTEYIALESFISKVRALPASTSPDLRRVLTNLCSLFGLATIINPSTPNGSSFLSTKSVSIQELDQIRGKVNELLETLLPDVIALTDAWDFTDASLCSAIGMADGNAYERVMQWVEQMPINQRAYKENGGVFQPGWVNWVDPVLKAKSKL